MVFSMAPGRKYGCMILCMAAQLSPSSMISALPSCVSAANPAKYPPIKFGDYALWFAAQRYQHMAKVETPSEAQVAPGARATSHWKS